MRQLNIRRIAAYSPEARGCSERQFKIFPGRLPRESVLSGNDTESGDSEILRTKRSLPIGGPEFKISHPDYSSRETKIPLTLFLFQFTLEGISK
jgi:hypothetical protein